MQHAKPSLTPTGFREFDEAKIQELTQNMPWMKGRQFLLCRSMEQLRSYIDDALHAKRTVIDLETTSLNSRVRYGKPVEKIVGISCSFDPKMGIYMPMNHEVGAELNLPQDAVLEEINRLCQNTTTIYHHAKFDLTFLRNYGVIVDDFEKFEDTLILARLYDAGQKDIKLKSLSERLLNQPMIKFDEIAPEGKFALVHPEDGCKYASSDAVCTLDLFNFFMANDIVIQQRSVYRLEKRTVFVVMDMESTLMKVDVPYLKELQRVTVLRLEEIRKEIYKLAGHEFNLGSPKQLGKILFDELKYRYPSKDRTSGGQYKTDTAILEVIAETYPIVKRIVEYRELEKSLGTYINNLLANHDENDCIKLGFNQNGTDTGRFSSPGGEGIDVDGYCGVNVQSLPTGYSERAPDIRKAFIARKGYKIVACDYSGEELRVAANLSGEPKWVNEFLHGEGNLHKVTAQVIFGRQEITPAERKVGKTLNFLMMYGGGSRGLSQQAKISENEARRVIDAFYRGVPQLKKWIDQEIRRARRNKFVRTTFLRMRPLAMFYESGDRGLEAHGDRCAVNTLIQGGSADIMKTTMVRLYSWIKTNNLQNDVRMLITMHDEIVFEIKEDKLDQYIPQINEIMSLSDILQGKLGWPIPLIIDAEYGDSWHVDHDYFKEHPEMKNAPVTVEFHRPEEVSGRYAIALGKDKVPDMEHVAVPEAKTVEVPVPQEVKKEEIVPAPVAPDPVIPPQPEVQTGEKTGDALIADIFDTVVIPKTETISPVIESLTETAVQAASSETIAATDDNYIYTIKELRSTTCRLVNIALIFLKSCETAKVNFDTPYKTLILKDSEGNSLLVSEVKIPVAAFKSIALFLGI